jgi:ABC-type Fe3+/spermidine/putrescine transport system ATPase subunit
VREASGAEATVEVAFGVVAGTRVDGQTPAPGAPALLAVRPEHVTLAAGGDADPPRHRGEVVEATFLGGVTRVSVRLGPVIVRADVAGAAAPAGGADVSVGWDPRHAHVLAADERFMDDSNGSTPT